jgi:flagellar basal-body rod protein FlgG
MIKANNFQVDKEGRIWVNSEYDLDDPNVLVSREHNAWNEPILLDTIKVVEFDIDRYLRKQGSSFFRATEYSGPAMIMEDTRPAVMQGFIEAANVEPVREMVQMIEVNRAYEANQRVIQGHDSMLGTLIQAARV